MGKILRDAHIGHNIWKIRKSLRYTQEEVVTGLQLLGSPIHRDTYAHIEGGRKNIYVTDLVAMQRFFNVDYADFFVDIPTSR